MSYCGEIERLASDNFGYFTLSATREVGVLSCELNRWILLTLLYHGERADPADAS